MSGHIPNATINQNIDEDEEMTLTIDRVLWEGVLGGLAIVRGTCGRSAKMLGGAHRVFPKETYLLQGNFVETKKYGRQFKAENFILSHDSSKEGIISYLRGSCPGINRLEAEWCWKEGLEYTIGLLQGDPNHFIDKDILTPDQAFKASAILENIEAENKAKLKLFSIFKKRGFGKTAINDCLDKWKAKAAEVVATNPFQLLLSRITRAGFKRVDKLYLDLGGDPTAIKRQCMAGWDAVRRGTRGNIWLTASTFYNAIINLRVGSPESRQKALKTAIQAGLVEVDARFEPGKWIANPYSAVAERNFAAAVGRLISQRAAHWPDLSGTQCSPHQIEVVANTFMSPFLLLTGSPGTGKTFTAAVIIKEMLKQSKFANFRVCAPTGKAAVRVQESLRSQSVFATATTIHGLLGVQGVDKESGETTFFHGHQNPIDASLVVVDEFSMCDIVLAARLFGAIAPGTHVLIIGDPGQLPPVGIGAPLRDLILAGMPNAELTEIQRNAGTIVTTCKEIKEGRMARLPRKFDFENNVNLKIVQASKPEDQLTVIRALIENLKIKPGCDVVWDCQVLTPLNDKNSVSRRQLNMYLQELLNPEQMTDPPTSQKSFRLRDKIICLKNNWDAKEKFMGGAPITDTDSYSQIGPILLDDGTCYIANGEIGRVVATHPDKPEVVLRFDNPDRLVKVLTPYISEGEEGEDLQTEESYALGFVITGHKSQGSEWPYIIGVIDPAADMVCSREWIYTVISRAKTWCTLVGSESVLFRQVKRAELSERKTFTKELLQLEVGNHG